MTIEVLQKKLESLICWIRERPEMYGTTAGEVDAALFMLHMIWAETVGRQLNWREALPQRLYGTLRDSEHLASPKLDNPTMRRLIVHWKSTGDKLGIRMWYDSWYDERPEMADYLAGLRKAGLLAERPIDNIPKKAEDEHD